MGQIHVDMERFEKDGYRFEHSEMDPLTDDARLVKTGAQVYINFKNDLVRRVTVPRFLIARAIQRDLTRNELVRIKDDPKNFTYSNLDFKSTSATSSELYRAPSPCEPSHF